MATKDLVPAGQREVIVRNTRMRVAALLAETFELLDKGKAKRDPVAALADEYWKNPLGFLERVDKLSGGAEGAAPGSTNIGQLFLQAVMGNQTQPQPSRVIDGEAVRGQSGSEDW